MKKTFFITAFMAGALSVSAGVVNVGSGSYSDQFPGKDVAGRNGYVTVAPQVSGNAANRPIPTNDWWCNELVNNHGKSMFNYPCAIRPDDKGLTIIKPFLHQGTPGDTPLRIGLTGLSSSKTTVCDHSDWGVTLSWGDMEATILQANPMVWYTRKSNADAEVYMDNGNISVDGNIIIVTNSYNGAAYAVYAPAGSTWKLNGRTATSSLNGKNYFASVMLPEGVDATTAAHNWAKYAFVFPKDTQANFEYNTATGEVVTTYEVITDVKEGNNDTPLLGMLPHHWAHLKDAITLESGTYTTVRGTMKMVGAKQFRTTLTFHGVLPTLPAAQNTASGFSQEEMNTLMNEVIDNDGLQDWTDSYNDGQLLNRLVQVGRIAKESGNENVFNAVFNKVKARVENWLTYDNGEVAFLFYYHKDWSTLLGYPAGHGQDTNINDHHFHWGYIINAAAFLTQYDADWAAQYGGMVNLLVRDAASHDRNDTMFPFMRNFSPYAGHSWANGMVSDTPMGLGIDQESTSESMQFASALIHWGAVSGNTAVRDLGIYLYVTEQSAINEYWFDVEKRNFSSDYKDIFASRVFSNSYDSQNFWGAPIEGSLGIQIYPVHAGSVYLVDNRDYAAKYWNEMATKTGILSNAESGNIWYDAWIRYYAMLNPEDAVKMYNNCTFPSIWYDEHGTPHTAKGSKFGDSMAHTYQWVHALAAIGVPDMRVTADSPLTSVFIKDNIRTYVAQNYGDTEQMVKFSDGFTLTVPAHSMAHASKTAGSDVEPIKPINPTDPTEPTDPDTPSVPGKPTTLIFNATDASEGSFNGGYTVIIAPTSNSAKISIKFDGTYEGFAGPWFHNRTNGFEEKDMTKDGDMYSYTITGLNPGDKITFSIKIAFTGGLGETKNIEYTLPQLTNIQDVAGVAPLKIANGSITANGYGRLDIVTTTGAIILSRQVSGSANISLDNLCAGVYIARFGNKSVKFVR